MTYCTELQTAYCKKESEKLQFSQKVQSIHNMEGEGWNKWFQSSFLTLNNYESRENFIYILTRKNVQNIF